MLTYNVAGLPEGLSPSQPERFIPQISPKLNRYDLVLTQEDFTYHHLLVADADHPFISEPKEEIESFINDGLSRLSQSPFNDFQRERWDECNGGLDSGNDCLADKGFSVAEHVLDEGVEVVVYNFHADAGDSPDDVTARTAQYAQITAHARLRAEGKALILAGDTNLKVDVPADRALLESLLNDLDLEDTCRSLDCGQALLDRVFFRSGDRVVLTAVEWRVADEMVDPDGTPLSDHLAVHALLEWRTR